MTDQEDDPVKRWMVARAEQSEEERLDWIWQTLTHQQRENLKLLEDSGGSTFEEIMTAKSDSDLRTWGGEPLPPTLDDQPLEQPAIELQKLQKHLNELADWWDQHGSRADDLSSDK